MANRTDGSIIIDTGLDNSGVETSAKEVERRIKSLCSAVDRFGADLQKSAKGYASNVGEILSREYARGFEGAAQKLRNLAEAEIPTDNYKQVSTEVKKAEAAMARLEERQKKLRAMGADHSAKNWEELREKVKEAEQQIASYENQLSRLQNNISWRKQIIASGKDEEGNRLTTGAILALSDDVKKYEGMMDRTKAKLEAVRQEHQSLSEQLARDNLGSKQWQSLQYDIEQTKEKLERLKTTKEQMEADGSAYINGSETEEYKRLADEVERLENATETEATHAHVFTGAMSALGRTVRTVADHALTLGKRLAQIGFTAVVNGAKKATTGLKTFASHVRKVISSLQSLRSHTHKADLTTNSLVKSLTSLKRLLIMRIKRMFISAIFNDVREGIQQLAKFSSAFDKHMSRMQNSTSRLSGNIAVLIGNVVSTVEPVITRIIDLMAQGIDWINQFIATLQGKSTYTSAKRSTDSYADSVDKASKAQQKLNRELYSFDEINRQGDNSNNSDNDGKSSSITYEEKPINLPSTITDWIERLKEAWRNSDWSGVGRVVADGINAVFGKLDDLISWENIGGTISRITTGITDILNSMVSGIDWEKVGRTFGSGINTVVNTLYQLYTGIDWTAIGEALATGLNGLVKRVDWDKLGRTFAARINALLDTIHGLVSTFDWGNAGKSFATAVSSLIKTVKWDVLRQDILDAINGVITAIQEFVGYFDWGSYGEEFKDAVLDLVENFPAEELGDTLSSMLTSALELLYPVVTDEALWRSLGSKFAIWLNRTFQDKTWWILAGKTINGTMKGLLSFGEEFLNEFDAVTAANNLKAALAEIDFYGIARSTWALMKQAFQKAGSFIDAMLNESIDSDKAGTSGAYLARVTEFNQKSIGEKAAIRLKEAFAAIPWNRIATELWDMAKAAFKQTGDFLTTLFDIDQSAIEAAGGKFEAIAANIGTSMQELGTKLGALPWGEYLSTAWEAVKTVVKGLIDGLLDSENGQVIVWVAGGLVALKTGLVGMLAKLVAGLGASLLASGPFLEYTIIALCAGVIATGAKYIIDGIQEMHENAQSVVEANIRGASAILETYTRLFREKGADAANEYVGTYHNIEVAGDNLIESLHQLWDGIQKDQGSSLAVITSDLDAALATYRLIWTNSGQEAANAWAKTFANIELTNDDLEGSVDQLALAIGKKADQIAKDTGAAAGKLKTSASNAMSSVENTTKKSGSNIQKNITEPLKESADDYDDLLKKMTEASDDSFKDIEKIAEQGTKDYNKTLKDSNDEAQKKSDAHNKSMVSTFTSMFAGIVASAVAMTAMNLTVTLGMNTMKGTINDALDAVSKKFNDTWANVKAETSNTLNAISGMNWSGTGNAIARDIMDGFDKGWSKLNSTAKSNANGLMDAITSMRWGNVGNSIISGIQDGVSNTWRRLENTVKSLANSLKNCFEGQKWWNIGDNIVAGIQKGVKDNWKWLEKTVRNLANSLFKAAKNELGISSPSKVFAEIGNYLDEGLQKGIEDGEPKVLQTVANLADAVTNEMSPENPKIDVTAEGVVNSMQAVISGLSGIADTFKVILDTIRTMGGFVTPQIAIGTVVPYKTRVDTATADNDDLIATLETLNEDLESVIIQAVNNAILAIVDAIQNKSDGGESPDLDALTKRVIDEINRRTRAQGSSPIMV